MKRLLAVAAVLAVAVPAPADIAPPIPKGFKRVPLTHRVVTDKEFPDYALFTVEVIDSFRGNTRSAAPAKLDAKTPLSLTTTSGASVSRSYELVAVPKDAGKKYATEKEFHKAVADGKVPGQVRSKTIISGGSSRDVKDSDPRKAVVEEYKLEKIDAKDGVVIKSATPAAAGSAPPKDSPKPEEEEEAAAAGYAPRGGVWVAGLAAAAAVVTAGLWVARRGRRELA